MTSFQCHIDILDTNLNITEQLANHCSLTRGQLKLAINKGALWLSRGKNTRRLRRLKSTLQQGDILHFYYNAEVLAQEVEDARLVADFQSYSVWYKPYGMLCQGSKWSDHCTINRFVEGYFNNSRPVFIVHRLDRAATGLIIIAHSKTTAKALTKMFEQRHLSKYYQIISHGKGNFTDNIKIVEAEVDNKPAKSTFSLLEYNERLNISCLSVKIDSGRKHQIRKHAASIGLPVVGDRLHGDKRQSIAESINLQLCAVKLTFTCPLSNDDRLIELDASLRPYLASIKRL